MFNTIFDAMLHAACVLSESSTAEPGESEKNESGETTTESTEKATDSSVWAGPAKVVEDKSRYICHLDLLCTHKKNRERYL